MLNNRGQVGETMTWIIGTLVIVVILAIGIFAASFMGNKFKAEFKGPSIPADLIVTKSLTGYLVTDNLFKKLQTKDEVTNAERKLADEIFLGFYGEEYPLSKGVWLGLIKNNFIKKITSNYRPTCRTASTQFTRYNCLSEQIKINQDKSIEVKLKYY